MKMRSTLLLVGLLLLLTAVPFVTSAQDSTFTDEPFRPAKTGAVHIGTVNTSSSSTLDLPAAADGSGIEGPAAVPGNNNFANATVIGSLPYFDNSVTDFKSATVEAGEDPQPSCEDNSEVGFRSVWYTYTPAGNVKINVDLTGSNFDTIAAIYAGTALNNLVEVACNDDLSTGVFGQSVIVEANLNAGQTYYIRVSDYFDSDAPIPDVANLNIRVLLTPAPLNVTVNTFNDTIDADVTNGTCGDGGGLCSLRAAVIQANYNQAGSVINLPAGTYSFSIGNDDDAAYLGDLDITQNMNIGGAGANNTFINAAGLDAHFDVYDLAQANLNKLTLTNGNRAGNGGSISVFQNGTLLSLTEVVLISNTASVSGGAIAVSQAALNASKLSLVSNTANRLGGGLYLVSGSSGTATVNLTNTTISGNVAHNATNVPNVGGGGVQLMSGSVLSMNNVTIASNATSTRGGGIDLQDGTVTTWLANTIIGFNNAPSNPDCSGNFASLGHNLISNTTGCNGFGVGGDLLNVNPGLEGSAASNGPGTTFTQRITAASPARNAGKTSAPHACIAEDQRGVLRGSPCDIGAVEFLPGLPTAFNLASPASGTVYDIAEDPTSFTWNKSASNGYNYVFTLTKFSGANAGVVYQVNLNALNVCGASTCTIGFGGDLGEAGYSWNVVAYSDEGAVAAANGPFVFTIGRPALDIAKNGSFELYETRKKPTNWTVKANSPGDKIRCNTDTITFSYIGNCAYRFKGSSLERTRIIQSGNLESTDIRAGDTVNLSYFIKSGSPAANLRVIFRAIYGNDTRTKVVTSAGTSPEYTQYTSELVIERNNVVRLKVMFKNRSKSGKLYIDNVQMFAPGFAAALLPQSQPEGGDTLPVPEAPPEFRR